MRNSGAFPAHESSLDATLQKYLMSKLGPYPLNSIVTGDARELAKAIPSGSVDIIFTDPIYSEKWMYSWLAEFALRVLKPSGVCLVWSNGKWHKKNTNWLEESGLVYRYDFACVMYGGSAPMNGKIISKTNRVIWLDVAGQSKIIGYLPDGYASVTDRKLFGMWKWTKNPNFTMRSILSFDGDIVVDPFCGQGTIPAACVVAQKKYVCFEVETDRAEEARKRLRNTQPPLPLSVDPVSQIEMPFKS